jgi:hypothetical protein
VQGNEFNELVFKLGYGIYTYTYTEAEGGKSNTLIDLSAYKESGKKYHLDIIRQMVWRMHLLMAILSAKSTMESMEMFPASLE